MTTRYAWGVTMILAVTACGGNSGATQTTTVATTPTSPASTTTVAAPTTTTVLDFSRESRLALGRCQDSYGDPANFARAVAQESIRGPSATLAATQKVCAEAEDQLKADNAPDDSSVGKMLAVTITLNESLDKAEQQIAAGTFLDPPCPNGAGCSVSVLASAVDRFNIQATARLG